MKLQGRNAVITGGAMGIGLATAAKLIKEGCTVAIWDINDSAMEKAKNELEKSGGKVFIYHCDVTDKNRVYELADQAVKDMGKVDILVNNAGYVKGGELLEQTDDAWEKTIDVNLTALIYSTRAFLPGMYERNSGHIVNISSAAGVLGVPSLAVYSATKWAVWGFTESMRMEAFQKGKTGVKWSSIHPSYLAHGMFEGAKLKGLGSLIVPLVKSHEVIAEAIVYSAIIKGRHAPKRPATVNLAVRLRGLLPDFIFQWMLIILGVPGSMSKWVGRK